MFLKDPGSARCVCSALYAPIDKIKEQGDESGVKRRVRGREGKRKGCFTSLTSYEGISCRSNWFTANSSQFSPRLEIDFFLHGSSLLRRLCLGFIFVEC